MSKAYQNITLNWDWGGDTALITHFNVAVVQSGDSPDTNAVIMGMANKSSRTYTFKNVLLDNGVDYVGYTQAVYTGGSTSDYVATGSVSVSASDTEVVESVSGSQSKAEAAESSAKTYASDAGNIQYSSGNSVDSKEPAESGADVTANNTAKDIANLPDTPDGNPGLFVDNTHLGFHDGSTWQAAIGSDGAGLLANGDIAWDENGNITAVNKITAGSGDIGGWRVEPQRIVSQNNKIFMRNDEEVIYVNPSRGDLDYVMLGKTYDGSGYTGHYGISAIDTNHNWLFRLDDAERKIAGWSFDKDKLYTSNIEIDSIGKIRHTNDSWRLNADGSGQLASGNISWDANGNVDVNATISATSLPKLPSSNSLKLYWSFDDQNIQDVTENTQPATLYSGSFIDGVSGKALELNGTSDYAYTVDDFLNDTLNGVYEFTVSFYLNPYSLSSIAGAHGTKNTIFTKGSSGDNDNIEIGVDDVSNNLLVYLDATNDNDTAEIGGGELTANGWHHVVLIWNRGDVVVFLDGNKYTNTSTWSNSSTMDDAPSPILIGVDRSYSAYFHGAIDEFRIHNRAVTDLEAKGLFLYGFASKSVNAGADKTAFNTSNDVKTGALKFVTRTEADWEQGDMTPNLDANNGYLMLTF